MQLRLGGAECCKRCKLNWDVTSKQQYNGTPCHAQEGRPVVIQAVPFMGRAVSNQSTVFRGSGRSGRWGLGCSGLIRTRAQSGQKNQSFANRNISQHQIEFLGSTELIWLFRSSEFLDNLLIYLVCILFITSPVPFLYCIVPPCAPLQKTITAYFRVYLGGEEDIFALNSPFSELFRVGKRRSGAPLTE